jgi:hypothetical protein
MMTQDHLIGPGPPLLPQEPNPLQERNLEEKLEDRIPKHPEKRSGEENRGKVRFVEGAGTTGKRARRQMKGPGFALP